MYVIAMTTARQDLADTAANDSYVALRPESPGNVWGFWTEADALAAIRGQLARHDGAVIAGWSLVQVPADTAAEWQTVAEGENQLALATASDFTDA